MNIRRLVLASVLTVLVTVSAVGVASAHQGWIIRSWGKAGTYVANGAAAVAGPWRLTSFRSEGIVEDGEVVEPAGMPCVLVRLSDPPRTTPFRAGTICRAPGKSDFNVTSVPVWDAASGKAELILLGFAPEGAAAVELSSDVGDRIRSQAREGSGLPSPVWVMAVPRGPKTGQLDWIDHAGRPAGEALDASPQLDRLAP